MDPLPQPGRRKVHFPGAVCTGEDRAELLFRTREIKWTIYTLNGEPYPPTQPLLLLRSQKAASWADTHQAREWRIPLQGTTCPKKKKRLTDSDIESSHWKSQPYHLPLKPTGQQYIQCFRAFTLEFQQTKDHQIIPGKPLKYETETKTKRKSKRRSHTMKAAERKLQIVSSDRWEQIPHPMKQDQRAI